MRITLPVPRLLPLTMAAMVSLLVLKSAALVRAAMADEAPPAAAASSPPKPPAAAAAAPRPNPAPAEPACRTEASEPAAPPISDSERALLLDLRGRRAELDAQAAALAVREATLGAAEKRLAGRLDELNALQKSLEALEADRQAHDEANWRGLVKLYEAMKPRDAATIFNDLDLPVLLPVVDRMKEAKAAPILAAMQPERARQVTAELAQLRTRAVTPAGPAARQEK
jgi:flagellar motility protein MotE (MotC chaperone)